MADQGTVQTRDSRDPAILSAQLQETAKELAGVKREGETTKRELENTKREGQTTKRELETAKRELESAKRIKQTSTDYGDFGAPGNYEVWVDPQGKPVTITAAVSIRVLDHGELNLITDAGRWFLFAPGTWKYVSPEQPTP